MVAEKDRLDAAQYCITSDPQKALAWYPGILEQLILLYGDYDEEASQQFMAENQCSDTFVWKLPTVSIVLIGQTKKKACILNYFREDPPPLPTPDPVVFTTDGL